MNVKYSVIFFVIFVWLKPVTAQFNFDAKEKERMASANVKVQTQWTYDYVNGQPTIKGYKSTVTKYDGKGNITEIINYNEKGEIISVVVYQYDGRGNRVNYEQYQDNRKKLIYSQKIIYDAKGNKIREHGFDGATYYSNLFNYDENGKLSEINYNIDNAHVEKRTFSYSGNKTEISIFGSNNNLTFKQENTYNDIGLLVSEIKNGGKGNMVHSLNLQYNNMGGLMEEIKLRAEDKLDYQKSYQYDSDNRLIKEETIHPDGTKFVSHEYQYNSQGDVVFETFKKTERAKEPSTKKYIYDVRSLYTEVDCYYATWPLKCLYKYTYEFY